MKTKHSFVTNSSSTSFIFSSKTGKEITELNFKVKVKYNEKIEDDEEIDDRCKSYYSQEGDAERMKEIIKNGGTLTCISLDNYTSQVLNEAEITDQDGDPVDIEIMSD